MTERADNDPLTSKEGGAITIKLQMNTIRERPAAVVGRAGRGGTQPAAFPHKTCCFRCSSNIRRITLAQIQPTSTTYTPPIQHRNALVDEPGNPAGAWQGKPFICGRRALPSATKPVLSKVTITGAAPKAQAAVAAATASSGDYYNDFLYNLNA